MTSTYSDAIISGWALVGHSGTYKFGNIGQHLASFITSVNHTKDNLEN